MNSVVFSTFEKKAILKALVHESEQFLYEMCDPQTVCHIAEKHVKKLSDAQMDQFMSTYADDQPDNYERAVMTAAECGAFTKKKMKEMGLEVD